MSLAAASASISAGDALVALAAAEGSAADPYLRSATLLAGRESRRNLADAIHLIALLHGSYPGVVDHAAGTMLGQHTRRWLEASVDAFGVERAWLARLQAAAGPIPSTPHANRTATVVLGQRHALETLARSERSGCALGTATMLLADWAAVRALLEVAGTRLGAEPGPSRMPDAGAIAAAVDAAVTSPGMQRAVQFGGQQLLLQHRGLWQLLAARQAARAEAEL